MARQQRIPGTNGPSHPEIDAKAEELYEVQENRRGLQRMEAELRDEIRALCEQHGVDNYHLDDADPPLVVKIVPQEPKVSVRKQKEEKANGAAEEEKQPEAGAAG